MNNQTFVLILAGGAGTRFWPASRESLPKQFLDITGSGKSLIRQTVDRFREFVPLEQIYIITHKKYGHLVRQVISELPEHQILLEPSRNNTAASIAYASLKLSKINPEASCIVAPADHVILKEEEFRRIISLGLQHAVEHDSLITLGINPTRPDSGYGYLEYDAQPTEVVQKVISFREKPSAETAAVYLNRGSFVWNAGIFIWQLRTILRAFDQHATPILDILRKGEEVLNTEDETAFIEQHYPSTEKISVDYAIMERAENVYTIPCDIGWSDVGTWNSLYELSSKDPHGNALISKPIFVENARQSLIIAQDRKLIVIKGLEDFIVVDTEDCLLIYPKAEEQNIKALKDRLREDGLEDYL